MDEKEKSDLEPMKVCPRCDNETSEEILNEVGGCYFCGNTDFSEEAYHLQDDLRKQNCSLCGRLVASKEIHSFNPLFHKFSKKVNVPPFGFVKLCAKCDSEVNVKQDFTIIKKIIDFHGLKK